RDAIGRGETALPNAGGRHVTGWRYRGRAATVSTTPATCERGERRRKRQRQSQNTQRSPHAERSSPTTKRLIFNLALPIRLSTRQRRRSIALTAWCLVPGCAS